MFNNLGLYASRQSVRATRRPPRRATFPVIQQIGGAGQDFFINGGTGPPGPPGPPGSISLVPVAIVTTTPFTPTLANYLLDVNVSGTASVVLPASPTGTVFIIKDISGLAAVNPITVTALAGALIDDTASALINSNYGSITLIFNSIQWNIT